MGRFWFHYNKPASQEAGTPKMTVHYKKQCLVVDGLVCDAVVASRVRKEQPRMVIWGDCSSIEVKTGTDGSTIAIIKR